MGIRNIVIAFFMVSGVHSGNLFISKCYPPIDPDLTPRFLSGYTSPELPKLNEGYKTSE